MVLLKKGSTGTEVTKLQTALKRAGRSIDIDGYFGPKTEIAVKVFQGMAGLFADGIVGPDTWAALEPYNSDYIVLREKLEACLDALEALPEFQALEGLIYGNTQNG